MEVTLKKKQNTKKQNCFLYVKSNLSFKINIQINLSNLQLLLLHTSVFTCS